MSDGNYLLAGGYLYTGGDFDGNYGGFDIGLIKIDSNGNKLWSTHYGSEDHESTSSLIKGMNNRYYSIGSTDHYGYPNFHGVPETTNPHDGYVICIDENGGMIWQHCYGGFGIDWFYTGAILDSAYLYVAGYTKTSNGGDTGGNYDPDTSAIATYDVFVCKIRVSDGSLVRAKRFGGTETEVVHNMIVTNDGNLLLLCQSRSNNIDVPVNYGFPDAWALLIDTSFNILSSVVFGGSKLDMFYGAVHLAGGDYMLYGNTENTDTLTGNLDVTITSGDEQILLIRTDSNFAPKWQRTYGCDYLHDGGYGSNSFVQTADGGFIMGGRAIGSQSCNPTPFSIGNSIFVKVDSMGNQLFEVHYGSGYTGLGDFVRTILVTKSGGIIVGSVGHADANNTCTSPGVDPTGFWNIYMLDNTMGIVESKPRGLFSFVYPNPASTEIHLGTNRFEPGSRLSLQVYDIQGKSVMKVSVTKEEGDILVNLQGLPDGLFLGRLADNDGRVECFKFVKE